MTELAAFGCDGVVAKLKDEPYHSGDRDAMVKVKRLRTADCVIGGFRYATKKSAGVGRSSSPLQRRRRTRPCRVLFRLHCGAEERSDQETSSTDP